VIGRKESGEHGEPAIARGGNFGEGSLEREIGVHPLGPHSIFAGGGVPKRFENARGFFRKRAEGQGGELAAEGVATLVWRDTTACKSREGEEY